MQNSVERGGCSLPTPPLGRRREADSEFRRERRLQSTDAAVGDTWDHMMSFPPKCLSPDRAVGVRIWVAWESKRHLTTEQIPSYQFD
ncbi:hypothetical protein MUK42_34296 [Musa troglodytarum]|uniref:Uncharacterized protein n=1 Tax=Musa troglodytarum TaxID=320322 RepID=A0A9E7EH72_9LILI|nr:hypothetical protein MUK42_34296 [Musa troglodytarum]